MKNQIRKLAITAATVAISAVNVVPADAGGCGRGGFGGGGFGRGGYGGFSPRSHHRAPSYQPPVYSQPSYPQQPYPQQSYPQQSFSQPLQTQPAFGQSRFGQQPVQPQRVQPMQGQSNQGQSMQGQSTGGQMLNSQTAQSQQSIQRAGQPSGQTQQGSQQTRNANQGGVAGGRANNSTVQNNSARQQPTTSTSATSQLASINQTDAATALQLLDAMSSEAGSESVATTTTEQQIPEFTAAVSADSAGHVGSWKVELSNGQSVELELNGDNTFRWTATKSGKSNSFSGQYRMDEGRLTLVRSNDLQQMAGSWTSEGENFTFKLDGATNGGLNFARS